MITVLDGLDNACNNLLEETCCAGAGDWRVENVMCSLSCGAPRRRVLRLEAELKSGRSIMVHLESRLKVSSQRKVNEARCGCSTAVVCEGLPLLSAMMLVQGR